MIQPLSAFSPQPRFRGSSKSRKTDNTTAFLNAAGTSLAAGALTTAVSRNFTSSWAQAGILGMFGSILTMFFITPMLAKAVTLGGLPVRHCRVEPSSSTIETNVVAKKKCALPKKMIQFKQN